MLKPLGLSLSDPSNGFPDNAPEEAGQMVQQTAGDLSGEISKWKIKFIIWTNRWGKNNQMKSKEYDDMKTLNNEFKDSEP